MVYIRCCGGVVCWGSVTCRKAQLEEHSVTSHAANRRASKCQTEWRGARPDGTGMTFFNPPFLRVWYQVGWFRQAHAVRRYGTGPVRPDTVEG